MAKHTKMTPWWHLAAGLFWLFAGIYHAQGLHFLSIRRTSHHDEVSSNFLAWLAFPIAALWLFAACREFMRMRAPSEQ